MRIFETVWRRIVLFLTIIDFTNAKKIEAFFSKSAIKIIRFFYWFQIKNKIVLHYRNMIFIVKIPLI